jgi:outer membrane protein TolC
VREASDQLSNIDALNYQLGEQQKSLDAAESAYKLASERYDAGLSSYLTVLNAETQVLNARNQRIELASAHVLARVSLLLALGGSFDPHAPLPLQTASR